MDKILAELCDKISIYIKKLLEDQTQTSSLEDFQNARAQQMTIDEEQRKSITDNLSISNDNTGDLKL